MTKRTRSLPPPPGGRHLPHYRIHHGKKRHLVAHLAGEPWPAHILDLSEVGITLLFDRRLNPGEVVTLSLHHIPRRFGCELAVRVVFATECQGAFLLGTAFTRELTKEERRGLL